MFDDLKSFFAALTDGSKHPARFEADDYRLAAAALMVHVATLDSNLSDAERDKLHAVLKSRFALDDDDTDALIDAAVAADQNAVDFYQFTSLLMRTLDDEGRRKVVAMMWEVAFVDGNVSEFEDNVMWRVADLLAVPNRERIELRQAVAAGEDPSRPA